MRNNDQNPIQCAQFEALLTDALDGTLAPEASARFHAHRAACADCALMFNEAQAGMALLHSLQEAEPPRNLAHNILVATIGAREASGAQATAKARQWLPGWLRPVLGPVLRPRFAMSAAMAFCSLSIVLSISGVKLRNLSASDFTPSALRDTAVRTYEDASARAHRYWDNLRFVYEVESRVRELKNAAPANEDQTPQQQKPNDNNKKQKKDDGGAEKREHHEQQYVQRNAPVVEARLTALNRRAA